MKRMLPLFLLAALPALADIVIIHASPTEAVAYTLPIVVQPSTQSGLADINTNADAYWVTFAGMDAIQGVVQGHGYDPSPCCYAVPVAGPGPEYLTGGFGSPLTSEISSSGLYFSTGQTSQGITIHFRDSQNSLAFLWGSIDGTPGSQNLVSFGDGHGNLIGTVTGHQVETAAGTINGFQGFDGSAWVVLTPVDGFRDVTFSSGIVSFEFAGVAAGTFKVPEPSAALLLAMMGGVLLAFVAVRKRLA
jgi:hypothetical protein